MRNQSYAIAWHGAGGDGLRQRTSADLPIVSAKADQLRQAAGIARNGASDISAAQRRVLYGIVKLFENACGSVDVSGLCGGT